MFRKLIPILVIVSMLLGACAGGTETPSIGSTPVSPGGLGTPEAATAGDQITIRFAVDDYETSIYGDLIKAFEKDNPGIRIKLVSINETLGLGSAGGQWPDDAWTRLASAADVLKVYGNSRSLGEQGLIRDLAPYVDTDATFRPDDFFPGTLSQLQAEGHTWGIPTTVGYQLIFFDKAAFDKAGVSYPKPGWTWDDFLAKARSLTVRDGDDVTQWGFVQPWLSHMQYIESRVGALIDASTEPPTPRFDQPDVVDAVRWYTDLFLDHKVTPYFEMPEEASALNLPEGYKIIESGQAAMWPEDSVTWQYRRQQKPALGVAPFPVDDPNSRTTPLSIQSLGMSAGSANPDAAWRWINFTSRQVYQLGLGFQLLPARRSVLESSGYLDKSDKELADALRYASDHAYVSNFQTGYGALIEAVDAILKGEKSVDDALAEAQTNAKNQIQEALAAKEKATPVPTIVVSGSGEETPSENAVTIDFITGATGFDLQPYRDLAQRFHEAHPDIVIEVKIPTFTSATIDIPDIAQDSDCFAWYPSLQDPKNLEAILSLEPFLDADPSFSTSDFYPGLLAQFTEQGQVWGLPAEVGPYVIEYNKDLFDAANVDYPELDWTMDDFLAAAVALTKGDGDTKQYGFVGDAFESNDLVMMIERLGARLVDDSVDPPNTAFEDPATIKAVRWYADLSTRHAVKPVFATDITQAMSASAYLDREALISGGRAAMWTKYGAQSSLGLDDQRKEMNIGVVPLPAGPGAKSGSYLTSSGYFISAETEARQACWQWITFLTGQVDAMQGVPARRSVAESDAYRQKVGAEQAAAYLASVGDASTSSAFQILLGENSWLGISTIWLSTAYGQVLDGKATVESALADAQQMADDYRACVVAHDAVSDQKQQIACAREVDPSLPGILFGTNE